MISAFVHAASTVSTKLARPTSIGCDLLIVPARYISHPSSQRAYECPTFAGEFKIHSPGLFPRSSPMSQDILGSPGCRIGRQGFSPNSARRHRGPSKAWRGGPTSCHVLSRGCFLRCIGRGLNTRQSPHRERYVAPCLGHNTQTLTLIAPMGPKRSESTSGPKFKLACGGLVSKRST